MLCAITAKRCEVPRRSMYAVAALSRELYIARLSLATRSRPRAQLCQLAALPKSSSQLGLASTQRSRAAWIAQLCSAFNDAV